MQVKKFEAPTIQEALELVKRELGPEAIILQTKQNRRGFGLLSKGTVEITAAVSERSLSKKQLVETRLEDSNKALVQGLPAEKQADIFDKYMKRNIDRANETAERVEVSKKAKKITATRYIDIDDDRDGKAGAKGKQSKINSNPSVSTAAPVPAPVPAQANYTSRIQAQAPQAVAQNTAAPVSSIESPRVETSALNHAQLSVESEVKTLRKMLEDLKNSQQGLKGGAEKVHQKMSLDVPALNEAFEQLVINGVERRYALPLIKKVAFELGDEASRSLDSVLDVLATEIMETVEVMSPYPELGEGNNRPAIIALIGPTGVGKTSTVAKLANEVTRKKQKVGLINFGGSKMNAFEQLGTYAKIINVPFRSAVSADDLQAALLDFKSLDTVIIDTVGRSQRETHLLNELQGSLHSVQNLRTFLVLSASTKDVDLYDAASRFSVFRPQGLVISKLDEATLYGSIYNLSRRVKLPLLAFTTGQTIPDDIEVATRERVASLIMEL